MQPGSPAEGYGCLSFPGPGARAPDAAEAAREAALDAAAPFGAAPASAPAARAGRLEVSGLVDADTTWDAALVEVTGDVQVADGATLTVAAGARVVFQGFHTLDVQGALRALGTPSARVVFTSAHPDSFVAGDLSPAGAWGGLRFENTPSTNDSSLLAFCVVEYAKDAGADSWGGALSAVAFSDLRLENVEIRHCTADWGGALFCSHFAAPELVGCLIHHCSALRAGSAVYAMDAYPRLSACTLADNADLNPEIFDPALAVTARIAKPRLEDCVVWGNASVYFEGGQLFECKAPYVRWSDVEGGHPGTGNLAADPFFTDAGPHPYAPRPGSACEDAGDPDPPASPALPALSLSGSPRVLNGRIDMGAYERGPATPAPAPAAATAPHLLPAHPNPFNPSTTIRFELPADARATLRVFDLAGHLVRTLIDEERPAGPHAATWDGRDEQGRRLPSGVYLCRLDAGGHAATRKLVLAK